ncbi:MAG: substrate-binding domain-containing protein [Oscillospiraceae bacterium]|jgi:ABC-type sugar transport system substrate-binding protein|nr:substrate-binding domain-containing protein [Oscillospiraceae bacterium]
MRGAGDGTATDGTAQLKSYTFGVNTWGSGVPVLDLFGDEAEYAVKEVFGMSTTRASDDFSADKELSNVQNFAAAKVDGMILQGAAVSTVPQIGNVCKDAKIPFVFHVFIGDDKDLAALADSNEYYVGAIDADMVRDGEEMGKAAYENGARTAVIIGGNVGDNNMDQRSEGFRKGFEALGGVVLEEARCTDNSECLPKATAMLNAHKDADVLYAMVGDYVPGSMQAIKDLKLDTKVYMSCVDEESAKLIKAGEIVMGNDGICLPSTLSATLILNYLDGHKILDADGKAPRFRTIPFRVTAENADAYLSVFAAKGVHPITAEVLKKLCYRYNPDVTYQDYADLISSGLTLNAILDAHGLGDVEG